MGYFFFTNDETFNLISALLFFFHYLFDSLYSIATIKINVQIKIFVVCDSSEQQAVSHVVCERVTNLK